MFYVMVKLTGVHAPYVAGERYRLKPCFWKYCADTCPALGGYLGAQGVTDVTLSREYDDYSVVSFAPLTVAGLPEAVRSDVKIADAHVAIVVPGELYDYLFASWVVC